MKLHLVGGAVAVGLIATGATLVGPALATGPSAASRVDTAVTTAADLGAAQAPQCRPRDLYVAKGRVEGATGNRYLRVRLVNVGNHPCSMGLATRAGFRDWSGALVRGAPSSGGGMITLNQGGKARTTIHWVDPGPVPAADCDEATATVVTLRVPSVGRTWRIPLHTRVCTTAQYAPDTEPLH